MLQPMPALPGCEVAWAAVPVAWGVLLIAWVARALRVWCTMFAMQAQRALRAGGRGIPPMPEPARTPR